MEEDKTLIKNLKYKSDSIQICGKAIKSFKQMYKSHAGKSLFSEETVERYIGLER